MMNRSAILILATTCLLIPVKMTGQIEKICLPE